MKKTIASWVFFTLSIMCMLVAPCVFVWMQYGDIQGTYKLSVTAIIIIIGIYLTFKKIVLAKWIKSLDAKIINIETMGLSITEEESIKANKSVWRVCSIVKILLDSILPICLGILAVLTIKVVEEGIIKLYGCLIFCLISIGLGIVFRIIEVLKTKLYHEKG